MGTVALTSSLGIAGAPAAGADWEYNPSGTWNGKKVYLSPARHSDAGSRGECGGNNENNMALAIAWNAVTHLTSSGFNYKVRVGNGTVASAIANSNAWGANSHIALHSNAKAESCADTNAATHGTVEIFRNGVGTSLIMAGRLLNNLGSVSPGTNDFACYNPGHPCTTIDLGELKVNAPYRAYSESEFHTWSTGVNWLTGSAGTAGFKVALSVYEAV